MLSAFIVSILSPLKFLKCQCAVIWRKASILPSMTKEYIEYFSPNTSSDLTLLSGSCKRFQHMRLSQNSAEITVVSLVGTRCLWQALIPLFPFLTSWKKTESKLNVSFSLVMYEKLAHKTLLQAMA